MPHERQVTLMGIIMFTVLCLFFIFLARGSLAGSKSGGKYLLITLRSTDKKEERERERLEKKMKRHAGTRTCHAWML